MAEALISVEVVYAAVDRQELLKLQVPVGATVLSAVQASGIGALFPDLDLSACALGIFGKVIADPKVRKLEEGDRVEIYRPLLADPKEVRRLRAEKAAKARKGQKSI
jgi:putative ubiquitin-RnfH superfamily antitoxin RatB of RatAB toxin-antitoxin module